MYGSASQLLQSMHTSSDHVIHSSQVSFSNLTVPKNIANCIMRIVSNVLKKFIINLLSTFIFTLLS
jgi:hypothetical protein